jgi:hypothetical protein
MSRPHEGVPEEEMTLEQRLDRVMYYRARAWRMHRDAERSARMSEDELREEDGDGGAWRDHPTPGRRAELEELDTNWVQMVWLAFQEYGAQIMDRLPPDTTVDPRTGAVTIDWSKDAWLDPDPDDDDAE